MARRSDESLMQLPELDELEKSKKVRERIKQLRLEAEELQQGVKRLAEIRKELVELTQKYGQVRIGDFCIFCTWTDGRQTLSKELLIENGVTPNQIKQSMKRGDGNWKLELPTIGANSETE